MSAWDNLLKNIKNILNKVNINGLLDIESLTTYDCEKKLVKNSLVYFHGHVYKVINVGYVEKNKLEPLDRFNFLNGAELVDILNPNNRGIRKFEYLSKGGIYLIKVNTLNESKIIQHNKPVSFIAYHGSVEDNLELAPNKAFYLCANYKLAKEFAYREVYGDGLYEGDVPMIYKFKGTFKNPYYLTEEEYDSEGQDSNIDFQKWVDMGVDGIVFQNIQTYYIVIDPSTIRLIGKKYLPFDEEYLERTDDQNNDKDDIIGENVEYHKDIEVLINPTFNEFKHFMKPKGWYRMCLTNDTAIVWDANTSILHQDIDKEYNLKNSEHIFIHKGKPYLQDYDLDEYSFDNKEAFLNVTKSIDSNALYKKYFPNHSMVNDLKKAFKNNGKYIVESICFNDMAYNEAFNKFEDLTVWKNPSIDWIKNQLKNIDLRFIYNPDADILYVWDGGKWMHSEVMDTVDMKMSANVNIIGVFSPGAVEIWAEISPADDADEAKMLTRKYAGKLLKQIYPYGYQLIAYT